MVLARLWGETPLPLDWPVYVTQEEACAFASWSGKRLPTEAEFHRAAYGTVHGEEERTYPWARTNRIAGGETSAGTDGILFP